MEQKEKNAKGNVAINGRRIDFLGYAFNYENIRLRKSIKNNFSKKTHKVKNPQKRREILASYWGWCKWGDCKNLWNKITNYDMSFAEHGITGRRATKDGQRFFDIKKKQIMDLINLPITVEDFETGIKTKHGDGRYVVKVTNDKGELCKFITNSLTLKDMLDQAKEKDLLPLKTTITKRDIGDGKSDYIFS